MALITAVKQIGHDFNTDVWLWENVQLTDTMTPVNIAHRDDLSIFVHGTLSGGASIAFQGSAQTIDPPTLFASLSSGTATIAVIIADTTNLVNEKAIWYKPVLTSGDGSTDIDIYLTAT